VIANLFRGWDAPMAFVGTVDSVAANNTIVEPRRWVLRILQETLSSGGYTFLPCGRNQFINNLAHFDRSQISTHANIGSNTDAASFEFAHNLWYAFNQPNQSRPTLPSVETNGVYALNPLFTDAAAGDYSVATNSPAVGKGKKLPNLKADLLEQCYADPPTLGAFEAIPPPPAQADADGDLMADAWEEAHGFNKDDPSDAGLDADRDGLINVGEYLAGTDPNDSESVFTLRAPRVMTGTFAFRYSTLAGRLYRVQVRDLTTLAPWSEISVTNGMGSEFEFRQIAATGGAKMFRVNLELER
jgi:hypothetical protein